MKQVFNISMNLGKLYKTLVNDSLDIAKTIIKKQKEEIIELKAENERLLCIIESLTKSKE